MNKREILGQLGLVALGVGLALVVREVILDSDADRRFALYNIRRELRKDMPRNEVESVISRHDAPFIMKYPEDDSIFLSVRMGGINMLYLTVEFSDGKLSKAYFWGEDNAWDVPTDAPPKIE